MKLEDIGFYTLSDYRAATSNHLTPIQRCEILITKRCNFSCKYCRGIGAELSPDEVKNIIHITKKDGLNNIRFSGGEPTLNLGTLVAGINAARRCKHIAVSTNGSADWDIYKMLIDIGVNDFSISLDACCGQDGDKISGKSGSWDKVVNNIRKIAEQGIYITVGVVVTEETEKDLHNIIMFADSLGVSDIRPIPAAQWKSALSLPLDMFDKYPILRYRSKSKLFRGNPVRRCGLALDDVAIMGQMHYPCIIYMREGGSPIGTVSSKMRIERKHWYENHNPQTDMICSKQCLDVCRDYNKIYERYHG